MNFTARRLVVLALLATSLGFLIPGLLQPVLIIRGTLKPDGVAKVAPMLLEQGLSDEALKGLQSMLNPSLVALLQATGGDLRQTIVERLSPQITASLAQNGQEMEVYAQTRSIVGSVQHLYEMDSPTAATLILLFSIIVPIAKAWLVLWSAFMADPVRRRRVLHFVELIAKWSMADVFVVAIFIAYLAAQATQATAGETTVTLVAFTAQFGIGFYWFTAYCLFSLVSQQLTSRWFGREEGTT